MKRVLLGMTLVVGLMATTGCNLLGNRSQCNSCNGAIGCRPCNLGWQRGGTDYQRHLSNTHRGPAPAGAGAAQGGPSAQVAYPYYTTRGPRDFLDSNPPSIGR